MTICNYGYTYISSITPSTGSKSFKDTGSTGWGGGVAGAAGCGVAATVRYGFRILHCYFPPDLGHSVGLHISIRKHLGEISNAKKRKLHTVA